LSQIVVKDLRKTFKVARRQAGLLNSFKSVVRRKNLTANALQGVSFELQEGELVGYIGPNGAGKSTTVKIMSGILVPDSGECQILGRTPWKDRIEHVRRIGVVFGQRTQLWWDVPVIDSFELLRDIYRVPQVAYARTRDELVEALGLESLLEVPVRQLSLGQKMKCELAASMLHRPPILFLDEPTIGLDAVSKLAVRDFIRRANRERGVTVILTTHDMDDIEALCSRILVIGKGQILSDGTVEQLRSAAIPERTVKIEFARHPETLSFPCARVVKQDDGHVELRCDLTRTSAAKLISAISQQAEIKDFTVENPPIEEIVARMYSELET
jgi:ABC-2 type transport system ATP-binding protein